jgi:hypothetical protein
MPAGSGAVGSFHAELHNQVSQGAYGGMEPVSAIFAARLRSERHEGVYRRSHRPVDLRKGANATLSSI